MYMHKNIDRIIQESINHVVAINEENKYALLWLQFKNRKTIQFLTDLNKRLDAFMGSYNKAFGGEIGTITEAKGKKKKKQGGGGMNNQQLQQILQKLEQMGQNPYSQQNNELLSKILLQMQSKSSGDTMTQNEKLEMELLEDTMQKAKNAVSVLLKGASVLQNDIKYSLKALKMSEGRIVEAGNGMPTSFLPGLGHALNAGGKFAHNVVKGVSSFFGDKRSISNNFKKYSSKFVDDASKYVNNIQAAERLTADIENSYKAYGETWKKYKKDKPIIELHSQLDFMLHKAKPSLMELAREIQQVVNFMTK